jgi:hypothetical protein
MKANDSELDARSKITSTSWTHRQPCMDHNVASRMKEVEESSDSRMPVGGRCDDDFVVLSFRPTNPTFSLIALVYTFRL